MITRTADRTLQIFETFAERRVPLTLSELARLLDMPVSTCSNLLKTMQARGYLYESGRRKAWYPTPRWLDKASAITSADPVIEHIRPLLVTLRDAVDETVLFGKRVGDQIVYLALVESTQSIRFSGATGDLRALASTASGKALLAQLPLPERLTLVARLHFPHGGPGTAEERRKLLADIDAGQKRGWWTTDPDNAEGVMALAAPTRLGGDLYTIVIAGPIPRVWPQRASHATKLLALCKKAASEF